MVVTKEEKLFFEHLLTLTPQKHNGYLVFYFRRKKYKRSRVLMQLKLNKILEMWEIVHHKNEEKTDDRIENLEVIDVSVHNSNHHAGKRYSK